jgi:hypothetical protein
VVHQRIGVIDVDSAEQVGQLMFEGLGHPGGIRVCPDDDHGLLEKRKPKIRLVKVPLARENDGNIMLAFPDPRFQVLGQEVQRGQGIVGFCGSESAGLQNDPEGTFKILSDIIQDFPGPCGPIRPGTIFFIRQDEDAENLALGGRYLRRT